MAKFNIIRPGGKREKTIVKLKLVVEMLHKTVLSSGSKKSPTSPATTSFFHDHHEDEDDDVVVGDEESGGGGSSSSCSGEVPDDVKEGHFAVFAAREDGEVKRFVVPLSYLEYPPFTRLLKQAEEEYGFGGDGALTVPCHPTELEKLLSSHQHRRRASGSFLLNRMTNWVDLST